jgi:hypothetical protein
MKLKKKEFPATSAPSKVMAKVLLLLGAAFDGVRTVLNWV